MCTRRVRLRCCVDPRPGHRVLRAWRSPIQSNRIVSARNAKRPSRPVSKPRKIMEFFFRFFFLLFFLQYWTQGVVRTHRCTGAPGSFRGPGGFSTIYGKFD